METSKKQKNRLPIKLVYV